MPGSALRKRSVLIAGHKTSVSLEAAFWDELRAIAAARGISLNAVIAEIDRTREGNLSSAIRLHVLNWLRGRIGHRQP
jgi:predicted DNA-binding ribbon-helix-helix protein